MNRNLVKLWGLRVLTFILLTVGATFLSLFIYESVLPREDFGKRFNAMRANMMENQVLLLEEWLQDGDMARIQEYIQKKRLIGRDIALFDESLQVIVGNPTKAMREEARKTLEHADEHGLLPMEEGIPPRLDEDRLEAMVFTTKTGAKRIFALHVAPNPMFYPPDLRENKWPLLIGMIIALLLTVAFWRLTERPSREMRKALKRLASGDYDVRLDPRLAISGDPLSHLVRDFNSTMENLSRKQEEQRYLLIEISHEMRSPLSRMAMAMELVRNTDQSKRVKLLERIQRDSDRLNTLSTQLLDFARLQWQNAVLTSITANKMLQDVVEECLDEALNQGKDIAFKAKSHCTLHGNREQLVSMIKNIILNAVRHTPKDTTVDVYLEQLDVPDKTMRIIVQDKGSGMSQERLLKVFEPFYQAADAAVKGEAGLGLTIARYVAEAHGGSISLANTENSGLRVTIDIPCFPQSTSARTRTPVLKQPRTVVN